MHEGRALGSRCERDNPDQISKGNSEGEKGICGVVLRETQIE